MPTRAEWPEDLKERSIDFVRKKVLKGEIASLMSPMRALTGHVGNLAIPDEVMINQTARY